MSSQRDPFRLGNIRRDLRGYSLHQRCNGNSSNDRLMTNQYRDLLTFTIIDYLVDDEETRDENFFDEIMTVLVLILLDISSPRLTNTALIPRYTIDFDSFQVEDHLDMFGFSKTQCQLLFQELRFPDRLLIGSARHSFEVSSIHCFLYTLFRLHSPSQRQSLDQKLFCYDYSSLSRIFNVVIRFIDDRYSSKLRNLGRVVHKFPYFNEKIKSSITSQFPGEPLPADSINCALFADGVRFRISRPSGEYWVQKATFSGHKWFHNHGSLAIMGPDGIIYDWYDIPLGKYSDKHFMSESKVNNFMEEIQLHHEVKYWIYTDKGFDSDDYIRAAAHGPGYVSAQEKQDNYRMGRERVSSEWCFAKVKQLFPFISRPALLKLQLVDVAAYVRVAVLLTNCHSCLNACQTALHFNCPPPTLNEYLQYFD